MAFPTYIAHRGAGKLAPENTLAAFKLGASLGYQAFECDVKLSADPQCFLLHDDSLERTSNGCGIAGKLTWAELAQLDAGAWLHPDWAGTPLASLADIAQFCLPRGDFVNLEIKPSAGTDIQTGQLVAHTAAHLWGEKTGQLLLSSFSTAALQAAQQARPQLARAHLFEDLPPDWLALAQQLACQGVVLEKALVSPHTIDACHRAGLWCASYTVNEPAMAKQFLAWGVSHLITDEIRPPASAST